MTTTAEKVAALLGGDGQRWETEGGRTLNELAAEHEAYTEQHATRHYLSRYVFGDGSAIVASEGAWDVEGSRPWSWAGLPEQDQTCAYCGAHTPEVDAAPDVHDDDAWDRVALDHEPLCEWVYTRAHRIACSQ